MHAVSIKAGGIVPLPRVGGALSHAVGSIRNLPRHCQTGICQPAVSERGKLCSLAVFTKSLLAFKACFFRRVHSEVFLVHSVPPVCGAGAKPPRTRSPARSRSPATMTARSTVLLTF
jgi:hypothetical protein